MAGSEFDPGGSAIQPPTATYADRLKSSVKYDQRLQRNILEIILEHEKSEAESFIDLKEENMKQLFETLGIDIQNELEGYQIKFEKVFVWLKKGVNLDKFCKEEKIRVLPGISTSYIKPAGRSDVTVTVVGLNFNTPDTFVMEYIKNFGRIVSNSVIYGKYIEGPFKGKFNGERKYQVDFSEQKLSMGTFHIIDGERVKVFYRGNKKTCARCHQAGQECPGGGSAKECEDADGPKVPLATHMKKLWDCLKFDPSNFELESDASGNNDVPIRDSASFPPLIDKSLQDETDPKKFTGISINNFPLSVKEDDILDFLSSLSIEVKKCNIEINKLRKNQNVTVEPLPPALVVHLHRALNFPDTKEKHFGSPLYCKPIRRLTPRKMPLNENGSISSYKSNLNGPDTSTPSEELSTNLASKNSSQNKQKAKKGLSRKSEKQYFVMEPPGLDSFEFSDYNDSDDDSFELCSKDKQASSEDENEVDNKKRQAGSPIVQEDFKRLKESTKNKPRPSRR